MVDLYCERLGPGLWGEPLNALSNLAFFVSAWAAWRCAQVYQVKSPMVGLLIATLAAIGIGSSLFHTFATHWARLADITPILLFQLLFLWIYCRRIVGIGTLLTCFLCVVLGIGVYVCAQFPHAWNGSLRYLPAFAVLLLVGIYHSVQRKVGRNLLLWASAVLALALFFRTIDNSICSSFTVGTHFLWHLLNSVVLYLLIRGIVVNEAPERA